MPPKRRTIKIKGQTYHVNAVSALDRHSHREEFRFKEPLFFMSAKLTPAGRVAAHTKGVKLKKEYGNYALAIYHSKAERAAETAQYISEGHRGGKAPKWKGKVREIPIVKRDGTSTREKRTIMHRVNDPLRNRRESLWEEHPWNPKREGVPKARKEFLQFYRDWMDGKIPLEIAQSPAHFADRIIRTRLGLADTMYRRKGKQTYVLNVAHGETVEPVLERLVGKTMEELKLKPAGGNEGLQVFFAERGTGKRKQQRVVVQYGRRKWDVTERYNAIVKQRPTKAIRPIATTTPI